MKLSQLLRALPDAPNSTAPNLEINAIVSDSRKVSTGSLFVAYRGVNVDGARFVQDAISRGAAAIVAESAPRDLPVPLVLVPDARIALAQLSAAWNQYPSRNLRIIGVTGTDGKTTTSTLVENILLAAGHTVGTITTVAAHIGGQEVETGFHTTTPDAPEVQAYLRQMVEAGTEYAVVEATSHGLAQHRLDAVDFDVAVVTNITHEHLDLHGSWENYRDAKAMLFRSLSVSRRKPRTKKVSVLNADDNERGVFEYLRGIPADEKVIYSTKPHKDLGTATQIREDEIWIFASESHHTSEGITFRVESPFGELAIESPLLGRYNVSNILAAVGAGLARRLPFEAIRQGVKNTRGIVGRMEFINEDQPFTVIVDFAHTPNALENSLKTARELSEGNVVVVFGCAGLRDTQKRAWMGEIAGRLADFVVLTAEDPRTEPLDQINAEIARGLERVNRKVEQDYFVVDDRGDAIRFAVERLARHGDVVLIAGKGHERSMCFGETEYPWCDQDVVREVLRSIKEETKRSRE